ncbi:MAG TPA: XTP/dITP diphosphatase [Methanocorpusculum sp.]|nr:XTP/dITP diphosphatase [Methanocorpusculum sp.]HJJ39708.1 XTP/dITP diphosphatase [Methanocorpusculum sp.]HJJ49317.1 XTP/dITP diphosphatase [Methanocorpusculum sp.]HJJ56639.1 XTP/dITP diphosphatase [Methanocorpusculum sp.]
MITVVTGNAGKAKEVASFFAGITEVDHVSVEMIEPQDADLAEVARSKAKQAFCALKRPLIVDDTGLFVDALNGFPGAYAAFVQDSIGNAGMLKLLAGVSNRSAYFETVIAYADENGIEIFSGRVNGEITGEERGYEGFGYDPIFAVGDKTLAEMTLAEKNLVSHRSRALTAFRDWYISRL